jgi:hypothetical protein
VIHSYLEALGLSFVVSGNIFLDKDFVDNVIDDPHLHLEAISFFMFIVNYFFVSDKRVPFLFPIRILQRIQESVYGFSKRSNVMRFLLSMSWWNTGTFKFIRRIPRDSTFQATAGGHRAKRSLLELRQVGDGEKVQGG